MDAKYYFNSAFNTPKNIQSRKAEYDFCIIGICNMGFHWLILCFNWIKLFDDITTARSKKDNLYDIPLGFYTINVSFGINKQNILSSVNE